MSIYRLGVRVAGALIAAIVAASLPPAADAARTECAPSRCEAR